MKYLKLYEQYNDIDIRDVAWLYFLHIIQNGKMSKKSWSHDKRMGVVCHDSLQKFNTVNITEDSYISDESSIKTIDKYFGTKTFKDSLLKGKNFEKFDIKGHDGYPISEIPYELYKYKNPKIDNYFEKIEDRIVKHFNSQRCDTRIIHTLSKSRGIKEFNFMKFFRAFPQLSEKIKIYRGIKYTYEEQTEGYSCWTYDKEQAERFARYHFSPYNFTPSYSKHPTILETEVRFEDIAVFVGDAQYEKEVILRNPVKDIKVTELEFKEYKI